MEDNVIDQITQLAAHIQNILYNLHDVRKTHLLANPPLNGSSASPEELLKQATRFHCDVRPIKETSGLEHGDEHSSHCLELIHTCATPTAVAASAPSSRVSSSARADFHSTTAGWVDDKGKEDG